MASTTKQIDITAGNAHATVNATVNDSLPAVPCPGPAGYRYVGARYVPLFADPLQWSDKNTYEPLTIVVDEGNSYTSKTYVPVGVDISDTDYWALTGNYNGQIEQYRQEVQGFDDRITAAQSAADRNYKSIVLIGDSYGADTVTTGWLSVVKPFLENAGYSVYAKCVSGAGFTRTDLGELFQNYVNDIAATMEQNEKDDVGLVVVAGGFNDQYNPTNITSGMSTFKNNVLANFKHARIKCAMIAANTTGTNNPANNTSLLTVYNNYLAGSNSYGFEFAKYSPNWIYRNSGTNNYNVYFKNDGFHPSQLGCSNIANCLTQFIIGGDYYFKSAVVKLGVTLNEGYTGELNLMFDTMTNSYRLNASNISGNFTNNTVIGKVGCIPYLSNNDRFCSPLPATITYNGKDNMGVAYFTVNQTADNIGEITVWIVGYNEGVRVNNATKIMTW